jgi:hypothetical protein
MQSLAAIYRVAHRPKELTRLDPVSNSATNSDHRTPLERLVATQEVEEERPRKFNAVQSCGSILSWFELWESSRIAGIRLRPSGRLVCTYERWSSRRQ